MNLLRFEYKGKTFYKVFEQKTHFHDKWIQSIRMDPELIENPVWLASGRSSYNNNGLMVA